MSGGKKHRELQLKPKEVGRPVETEGLLHTLRKGELVIGILLGLVPWGLSLIGFAVNIWFGGSILLLAFLLAAHYLWRRIAQWPTRLRLVCLLIASVLFSVVVGRQMLFQYRIQHPIPEPDTVLKQFPERLLTLDEQRRFVTLLGNLRDREKIRLRCPSNDEQVCTFAGQFIELFRTAGWALEGEKVDRLEPTKLGPGVLLLRRGEGTLEPSEPNLGLWVTQTPSLIAVKGTLTRIGIATGTAPDPDIPDGVIGISFGSGPYDKRELTLMDLFEEDIPQTVKIKSDYMTQTKAPNRERECYYRFQVYLDWQARSKFIGFYLPMRIGSPDNMIFFGKNHKVLLADMEKRFWTQAGRMGDEPMNMRDLVFSGQVFLYYEGILSPREKVEVIQAYRKAGLNPQFRGLDYLSDRRMERKVNLK